jgi:hypothetical protein
MARKRFFFVHLAIFAALCSTFLIAGLSSYREYMASRGPSVAAQPAAGVDARPAGVRSPEIPVLALSAK